MKTGLLFPKSTLLTFLFFLLFCSSSFTTFAQLIGKYEFTGVSTLETQNNFSEVTTQPSFATFSPFKREVVQWWRGDNVYNSREWGKTAAEERYIEFTITAKPDYALSLTSLSFDNYRTDTGPTNIRVTHNANGTYNTTNFEFLPSVSNSTKTTWDFDDVTIKAGGSVTFRIYGYGASSYLGAFRVDNVSLYGTGIPQIKLNEFHYANTAVTRTGFLEVAVPKDFTNLNSVQIAIYKGDGNVNGTFYLSNFKVTDLGIDMEQKLYYLDVPAGLPEDHGAICIYSGNYIMQFLSYGGTLKAVSGPANGLTSQDVNITEAATDGPDNSLYLALKGNANYAPGTWGKGFDNSNTKGFPNDDYSVLPVELLFFRANAGTKEVNLSWATATEKDNDQFVIERSQMEVSDFRPIGTVKGNGTTTAEKQYRFVDRNPFKGTSYYRLKQIDFDGTITYSAVIALNFNVYQNLLTLYPNPATTILQVDLGNVNAFKEIELQVVNALGKEIYRQTATKLNGHLLSIPVSSLPAGTYYLVLIKDGVQESKAFIKR